MPSNRYSRLSVLRSTPQPITLEQRWPVRICVGQQSAEEEELLLRAANLTLLAPAQPVAAAPICCRRDNGVFLSDAYIQLMTPHVNAMLAGPASSQHVRSASLATSSIPADAVEIVKVRSLLHPLLLDQHSCSARLSSFSPLLAIQTLTYTIAGTAASVFSARHACNCSKKP